MDDEGELSSDDMAKTPSLGTRRWLRRREAGVGVDGAGGAGGKPVVDDNGAVRGAVSKKRLSCCHVAPTAALGGTEEVSRIGVVGGVSVSSP